MPAQKPQCLFVTRSAFGVDFGPPGERRGGGLFVPVRDSLQLSQFNRM